MRRRGRNEVKAKVETGNIQSNEKGKLKVIVVNKVGKEVEVLRATDQ